MESPLDAVLRMGIAIRRRDTQTDCFLQTSYNIGDQKTDALHDKDTSVNRRDILRSIGAVSASLVLPKAQLLLADGPTPGSWRTFEVKTRVEILNSSGATRVWLPAALVTETPFQKTLSNEFSAEGGTAGIVEDTADGLGIVAAEFPAGSEAGPHTHEPSGDQELCCRSLRARQGAASGPRRVGPF